MKPVLLKIWLGLVIFISPINGLAQTISTRASLSFRNFRSEDGLSDNFINAICQDQRGFIWISTREGLNRYDGSSFKKFYPGKSTGNNFTTNIVGEVHEYRQDRLLISISTGLVIMNTIDQQFFPTGNPILDSAQVIKFYVENRNKIWLGFNDGLIQVDSSLHIHKMIRGQPGIYGGFKGMHRMQDGRLLVVSMKGIYFLNENTMTAAPYHEFKNNSGGIDDMIFSFYDNRNNSLYTVSWNRPVSRYDFANKTVNLLDRNGSFRSLIRDSRGHLWLGGETGLYLYDEKTNHSARYLHQPEEKTSLVHNVVTTFFEDRDKNLWIGTPEGISKLSIRAFSLSYYRSELRVNGDEAEIYDIAKAGNGNICISTYGNGVFCFDSAGGIANYGRTLMPFSWSINPEGKNLIVTGHGKMIYRLDVSTGLTTELPILKPYRDSADLFLFAYTDRSGNKWYSINKQMGLFYQKNGRPDIIHFSNKTSPPIFQHSYFNMALEDNRGRIWFGMNKRSDIVAYDYNSDRFHVHEMSDKTGVHLSGVDCLLANDDAIWVGTNGTGLIRYNPDAGSARLYTVEDGLSSNNITSLVYDSKHRLWVGTSRGLSCLLPGEERFASFTQTDGLPETFFGDGAIYYDTNQNRIYAAAKTALIHFNPDQFLGSGESLRRIHIDEISVNGKKISFSSLRSLKLPYTQNNLQFAFTAIDFQDPGNILFFYKLDGADKDWIAAGNQRSATYTSLPNGHYRFLVKATWPGDQISMQTEIPFAIFIQPPFWKTWWFRGSVALFIILLVYFLVRSYYRRQLEQQRLVFEKQQAVEQERTRIATDMHDDFGAGLSRIKFLSQVLSNKNPEDEVIRTGLEKITGYSEEMAEKMGEIVWALNEKNDTLADLIAYTRAYTMEYLAHHEVDCRVNTPLHFPVTFIPGDIRRNIFLAVKESLHNIIKHAAATSVYFSIELNGKINITIHDNGKGIDWNNQRQFGNGLQNIRKRMQDIKGKADFLNELGTKVMLEAPLHL